MSPAVPRVGRECHIHPAIPAHQPRKQLIVDILGQRLIGQHHIRPRSGQILRSENATAEDRPRTRPEGSGVDLHPLPFDGAALISNVCTQLARLETIEQVFKGR